MASVHTVYTTLIPVLNGVPTAKTSMTIGEASIASQEMRVVPDTAVPNSANYPTIKAYLTAEYAGSFKLVYMSNNMIVTDNA